MLHDVVDLRSTCIDFIKEELTSPSSFIWTIQPVDRTALLEEKLHTLLSKEARMLLVANGILHAEESAEAQQGRKKERKEKKKGKGKKKKRKGKKDHEKETEKDKEKEKEKEREKETA